MTAITLPAYTPVRFDVPTTIILEGAALTKVLAAIPTGDLADALEMIPTPMLDNLLTSLLTDKSIEWMLTEAVQRVKLDKVATEAATLRALVECVKVVAEIDEDEDCAEAIRKIREAVRTTPTEGAQA